MREQAGRDSLDLDAEVSSVVALLIQRRMILISAASVGEPCAVAWPSALIA
jgi:hypothetical protein